jgi:hypothetical protein
VSGKGDVVSERGSGKGFDLVATIGIAVIFAVIVLWVYERIVHLWMYWKVRREDPLWHLRKKR